MKRFAFKSSLCGVLGALAVVIMLMGGIIPFATFCAPAIAGILIIPIAIEFGRKTALLAFVAVSLLTGFLVPDKEMAIVFIGLLGYYPLLKISLEKIKNIVIRVLIKLGFFNIIVFAMYSVMIFIFNMQYLAEEFSKDGTLMFFGVIVIMANVTFFIYDFAIKRLTAVYCTHIRPKIIKMH